MRHGRCCCCLVYPQHQLTASLWLLPGLGRSDVGRWNFAPDKPQEYLTLVLPPALGRRKDMGDNEVMSWRFRRSLPRVEIYFRSESLTAHSSPQLPNHPRVRMSCRVSFQTRSPTAMPWPPAPPPSLPRRLRDACRFIVLERGNRTNGYRRLRRRRAKAFYWDLGEVRSTELS